MAQVQNISIIQTFSKYNLHRVKAQWYTKSLFIQKKYCGHTPNSSCGTRRCLSFSLFDNINNRFDVYISGDEISFIDTCVLFKGGEI